MKIIITFILLFQLHQVSGQSVNDSFQLERIKQLNRADVIGNMSKRLSFFHGKGFIIDSNNLFKEFESNCSNFLDEFNGGKWQIIDDRLLLIFNNRKIIFALYKYGDFTYFVPPSKEFRFLSNFREAKEKYLPLENAQKAKRIWYPLSFKYYSRWNYLKRNPVACSTIENSKEDSTMLFEKQKGKLPYPLKERLSTDHTRRIIEPCCGTDFLLLREKKENALSIFEGKIILITEFDNNNYTITTKFGSYYISYTGLSKPSLKVGDYIIQKQILSELATNIDGKYELSILISKTLEEEIDPRKWFYKK